MGPLFPIAKMAAEPEKDASLGKQIQQSLHEFTERHKADLGMAALTYTHVLLLISLLCELDKGWKFKPTFEVEKLETEEGKPRKYVSFLRRITSQVVAFSSTHPRANPSRRNAR